MRNYKPNHSAWRFSPLGPTFYGVNFETLIPLGVGLFLYQSFYVIVFSLIWMASEFLIRHTKTSWTFIFRRLIFLTIRFLFNHKRYY